MACRRHFELSKLFVMLCLEEEEEKKEEEYKCASWTCIDSVATCILKCILLHSSLQDLLINHRMVSRRWNYLCDYNKSSHRILWLNSMKHSLNSHSFISVHDDDDILCKMRININKCSWSLSYTSLNYLMINEYFKVVKCIIDRDTNERIITNDTFITFSLKEQHNNLSLFVNDKSNTKYINHSIKLLIRLYNKLETQQLKFITTFLAAIIKRASLYSYVWILEMITNEFIIIYDNKEKESENEQYEFYMKCCHSLTNIKKKIEKYNRRFKTKNTTADALIYKDIVSRAYHITCFCLNYFTMHCGLTPGFWNNLKL